jgi:hypothetical protein|tara:strand:+ start:22468 stop:23901 length:1434 start_codon:yes stop_codon:yes gene_type:complete
MELVEKKYVRRNIISLKETYPSEFGRFIHALRNLQLSDDWSRICGIHGNTFKPDDKGVKCPTDPAIVEKIGNTPDEPFYCAHSQTKFAVFHTVYIYQFELLLNKYNTSNGDNYITLPYLFLENNGTDYSFMNETNITILFDNQEITIENPLAPQNVYYFDTKGEKKTVQRNGSLTPKNLTEIQKLDVINKELNNVLYAERYPTFSSNTLFNNILKTLIEFNPLEIPHNNLHDYIGGPGGNMSDVPLSAYDPLFWMHHCNIDRFFYNWMFNNTNGFENNILPPQIPEETLNDVISPFSPDDVYSMNHTTYEFGYLNDKASYIKVKNMLDFSKYPYSYNKILIQPYNPSSISIELHGIPIPKESTHIEVYLYPNNVELTDENKLKYTAGSTTWHGINRYTKCCKRCNDSRTNLKIDIEDYIVDNNIQLDQLKTKYKWHIEGYGRLHQIQNEYVVYSENDIIKDGSISLLIQIKHLETDK